MRPAVDVRPTVAGDTEMFASRLRAPDRRELIAGGSPDFGRALRESAGCSLFCWTATADGEPVAIGGVSAVSVLGGIGAPWLLGTDLLDRYSRVLVRQAPGYIAKMHEAFPVLVNFVHAENARSVRWLKALGFEVHDPVELRPGALFHPFEKRA